MAQSRRHFLQSSALLAATLPLARFRMEAAEAGGAAGEVRRGGLLFGAEDLPRIRANAADPRFAAFFNKMLAADVAEDADFITTKARNDRHVADMLRVRTVLERASFIYVINGDPRQLELARAAIRRLIDYPTWDLFLEGGTQVIGLQRAPEATIALIFALDWLGGALTAEERAETEKAIVQKGAPPCYTTLYGMKYPDRVRGWSFDPAEDYAYKHINLARWPLILNATNLKIIPTAALGIAGCWFRGRHPQAEAWLELARSSAKAFSTMYGSDGAYDEGVSYWGYTTLHLALLAEVLWRTQGIDDRALIDYPGTVRYALAMTLPRLGVPPNPNAKQQNLGVPLAAIPPRYDIVNFGDANGAVDVSVAAWVARTHGDALAQHVARDVGEANFHYGMIWYDPAAQAAAPEPALLDRRLSNDLVVSRSGWTERDGEVALRSGGPANHEHADRNSVIFKAHGERLLHDPFRAAYSATLVRWKLRLTEAHTAVLIDGKGHQYHDGHEGTNASWAWARVTAFRTFANGMVVTSDATEAYALVDPRVRLVERTLVFLKPDVLLMLDRVRLTNEPASVQLRFQVYNEDGQGAVAAESGRFTVTRPHATLRAQAHRHGKGGELRVRTAALDLPPEEGSFPLAEVESAAALEHTLLTVCTAQAAGGEHGTLQVIEEKEGWRVRGRHNDRAVDVTLKLAGGKEPLVEVQA